MADLGQSETSAGRDMEPLADRPGYNAKPTDWVRYANHLEAELQRLRDDEDSAGAECGRLEADIYGLHAGLEDAGLPGAINAESIEERIGKLVDVRAAAEWVVLAWDNEQTQHLSMPNLREALGWPRERPNQAEARRRLNAKCGIEAPPKPLVGADDEHTPRGQRITHGRHCTCSACAREDWTSADLAPCGMHGSVCPALYQPWGPPGSYFDPARDTPSRGHSK